VSAGATAAGGLRRAVTRGAAAAFALRAGGMGLALAAGVVLAHALGAPGYGTYQWAFAWVSTLALIATLGTDQLLVREAGIVLESGRWGALRALVRSTLGRVTAVALAVAALGAIVVAAAGGGLGARQATLLAALPILPLAAATNVAQGALLGLGRTARALAPGTIGRQAAFLLLVAIGALLGGLTAAKVAALQLVATAIAAAAVLMLLRRALAGRQAGRESPPAARAWLRESVPMGTATVLLAVDAQVGLLVLGALGSATDTGVYAAARLCTAPFTLVIAAGRLPLAGVIARLGATGEWARLQRGLRTATRGVALVSAAIAAVLIIAPGLVLGMFGAEFAHNGGALLRILALAQLVNAICAYNGLVLIMAGHERAAMAAALGGLVLDGVLCVALVPALGARGAAIAVLASVIARNVVNSVLVRRRLGIDATVLGRI
jgi:O-antigen/teichoic acid export membrane protein